MEGTVQGQTTQSLRSGTADVRGKWRSKRRGAGARLSSRCIRGGGGTKLAAKLVPEAGIKKKNMWSSDALMVYVAENMECPVRVSGMLGDGSTRNSRDKGLYKVGNTK